MPLIRQLHGVKHQLAVGGSEDIADSLDIQHTFAHKASLSGFVAGAAIGHDRHTVGVGQILADDQMPVHIKNVGVGQTQANQFLIGNRFGGIDKLLHVHVKYLSFQISCLYSELRQPAEKIRH